MLDFSPVARREKALADLAEGLTPGELHALTDEMIDTMLSIIAGANDADVVFVPHDPHAHDSGASEEEATMAWTLGHVVVHTTAGSEEAAAVAAWLARGVHFEGRSHAETHWTTIRSIEQVRARLEESRRMRHAFLNAWPDEPRLDLIVTPVPIFGPMNAVARFLFGLFHEDGHLDQLREIMRQARAARGA
ncbi:MAG TPA: DinB family protein [Herpetosiphonaceae bacterium]